MKLLSWNVNGIRSVAKKGFADFLRKESPDIIGLQEVKISDIAREKEEFDFVGYDEYWNPARKAGYSGTAILARVKPAAYWKGMELGGGEDEEGRVQTMEFENFFFINAYFPNSGREGRLDYKEKFNAEFLRYVQKLEEKKPVVVCGDLNVAHKEIDLARPKENVGNPGFTDEERGWMDTFLESGLIDAFRLKQGEKIQYSWWSYRMYARDRGIGWRIDYFLVSEALADKVTDAFILDQVLGSDHAPVGIRMSIE